MAEKNCLFAGDCECDGCPHPATGSKRYRDEYHCGNENVGCHYDCTP